MGIGVVSCILRENAAWDLAQHGCLWFGEGKRLEKAAYKWFWALGLCHALLGGPLSQQEGVGDLRLRIIIVEGQVEMEVNLALGLFCVLSNCLTLSFA